MVDLGSFMELLSPTSIYDGTEEVARFVAVAVTPVLVVIAIWIRTFETQLDAVSTGMGKWGIFIKDLGIWLTVIAVYFMLVTMVADLFNPMYKEFSSKGSLSGFMNNFVEDTDKLNNESSENITLWSGLTAAPALLISYLFYYFTLIAVVFLEIFLKLAHAFAYSFGIVWGLVVIPLAITKSINILSPWAKFMGILLVWPIVHFISFSLFIPLFHDAAEQIISGETIKHLNNDAALHALYSIIHLIVCATLVAAPLIAQSLVTSGSITGLVAPFAAAGMGAGAMVSRVAYSVASNAKKKTGGSGGSNGSAEGQGSSGSHHSSRPPAGVGGSRSASLPRQQNKTSPSNGSLSLPKSSNTASVKKTAPQPTT